MTELLPCPFCGGEADVIDYDDECWVAHQCPNGTSAETYSYDTAAEAIAAWNTRAERTCHMKPVYASNALECSECSSYVATWDTECDVCNINYCPNCGAKVVSE